MSEHVRFHLVYDGPALAEHRMEVRDLAPALVAMGDLMERANALVNGDRARVAVNVRASFKEGSFGIDLELVQGLVDQLLNLANHSRVTGLLNLAGLLGLLGGGYSVITLIRTLRHRSPRRIEPVDGDKVRIHIDAEVVVVERAVIELYQDWKLRKALEALIARPLEREGVDSVALVDHARQEVWLSIDKAESRLFVAPSPEIEELPAEEFVANLQLVSVAFREDNKWRFTDGATTFHAAVRDAAFLDRVGRNQEAFAKDDVIKARVRRRQQLGPDGLRSDYEIIAVLEHRSSSPKVQLNLDLPGPDS